MLWFAALRVCACVQECSSVLLSFLSERELRRPRPHAAWQTADAGQSPERGLLTRATCSTRVRNILQRALTDNKIKMSCNRWLIYQITDRWHCLYMALFGISLLLWSSLSHTQKKKYWTVPFLVSRIHLLYHNVHICMAMWMWCTIKNNVRHITGLQGHYCTFI